nr:MAG TPA: hypothetical protein [Caudoviricetes sp.]
MSLSLNSCFAYDSHSLSVPDWFTAKKRPISLILRDISLVISN